MKEHNVNEFLKYNSQLIFKHITELKNEIRSLEGVVKDGVQQRAKELQLENEQLSKEISKLKQQLQALQTKSEPSAAAVLGETETTAKTKTSSVSKSKPKSKKIAEVAPEDEGHDVSKLDLRIGKITKVEKHPNADSLYVEVVDFSNGYTKTIISGLVKHVPIENMQDRIAVFICNIKPVKMRGILSEGMIMCANTPDKVEILKPPQDSVPGDVVTIRGYPRKPEVLLNPKKKILENLLPLMKTNNDNVATFDGAFWEVEGKGLIISETLSNAIIK